MKKFFEPMPMLFITIIAASITVIGVMRATAPTQELYTPQKSKYDLRHWCLYDDCPMTGGKYFHGCGSEQCIKGSECWEMDELHWEFPVLSYDEIDSIYQSRSHINLIL